MVTVKMVNGTVPYNLDAKFKAAKLMVHPASEGT
jgi:ribosomal protein S5